MHILSFVRFALYLFRSLISCILCWVFTCNALSSPQYDAQYDIRCTEPAASHQSGVNTKLSGIAFDVDVVLMQKGAPAIADQVLLSQIKSIKLDLVDTASRACLDAPVVLSRTLVLGANGYPVNRGVARGLLVRNSAQSLMCRATIVSNMQQTYTVCDSGQLQNGHVESRFSIRPAYFSLTSRDAIADANGQSNSATPLFKASTAGSLANSSHAFNLNLIAKNVQGAVTSTYIGLAIVMPEAVVAHRIESVGVGNLRPTSFNAAVSGVSSGNFTYSEVGYFKVLAGGVKDNTYTLRDQGNGRCVQGSAANVLQAGKYGCDISTASDSAYFGRFVPDSFKLTAVQTEQGCSSGDFTYVGGDFSTRFVIEAVNDANVRTQNYHAAFARFANRNLSERYASYQFTLSPTISTVALQQGSLPLLAVSPWQQGRAEMRVTHQTTRPATPLSPTAVYVQAQPADGETQAKVAQALSTPLNLRMGRMRWYNAYGAETVPLRMQAETQYWNGLAWTTHTEDSCTLLEPANIWMNFPASGKNHLSACETYVRAMDDAARFVKGRASYLLAAPGYGNDGWVALGVDFGLTPSKQSCVVRGQPQTVQRFGLRQFMDANTTSDTPLATLSFGQYKSAVIYHRAH